MPRVPQLRQDSVIRGGSVGRMNIDAPVEAFGGGNRGLASLGQGLQSIGAGMQRIGEKQDQDVEREKLKVTQRAKTDVSRARSEAIIILNRAKLDADNALRSEDVDRIYNLAFEDIHNKKGEWLSNDEANAMFNDFIDLEFGRRSNEAVDIKMRISKATEDANYLHAKDNLSMAAVDSVSYMRNRELRRQNAQAYFENREVPEAVQSLVEEDMRDYDKRYLRGAVDRITASGSLKESSAELAMFIADVNGSGLDQETKDSFLALGERSVASLAEEIQKQRIADMNNYFDTATEDIFAPGRDVATKQKLFMQYAFDAENMFGEDASKKIRTLKKVMDAAVGASDAGATLRSKSAFYQTGDITAAEQQLEAEAENGNISGTAYNDMKGWIKGQKDDLISKELKPVMKEIMDSVGKGKERADVLEQQPAEGIADLVKKTTARAIKGGQAGLIINTWNDIQRWRGDKISEEEAMTLTQQLEEAVRSEGAVTPQARQQVIDSILHPLRLKKAQRMYDAERWQERLQQSLEKGKLSKEEAIQTLRKQAMTAKSAVLSDADIMAIAESEPLEK